MSVKVNNFALISNVTTSPNIGMSFRGANSTPNDRVDLSTKKNCMSNGAKAGIGVGILSVAALGVELVWGKGKHLKSLWEKISGNKAEPAKTYVENIEKLQEHFNKIFDKNFTKDEANEMAQRYKEAFLEKEDLSFITKLFNQLIKDYDLPLKTAQTSRELGTAHGEFSVMRGIKADGTLTEAGMSFNANELADGFNRKLLTQTFAHELKHAQQMKICIGADKRKFIEDSARKNLHHAWYQDALRARGGNAEQAMNDYVEKIEATLMLPEYRNIEKIDSSSPLYQRGLDYLENWNNYIKCTPETYDAYKNQLVEREAHDVGDRFAEIYEMLTK